MLPLKKKKTTENKQNKKNKTKQKKQTTTKKNQLAIVKCITHVVGNTIRFTKCNHAIYCLFLYLP
jgi:ERCC4-type nuclease